MKAINKKLNPFVAARAVAQYFPADPAVWLEQCALAWLTVTKSQDDRLCIEFNSTDTGDLSDTQQRNFLMIWLNLTPGGSAAVVELLKIREAAAWSTN